MSSQIRHERIERLKESSESIQFSSSVATAIRELRGYRDVSASQIVASLLQRHEKDYAQGRAKGLHLAENSSASGRRSVDKWLGAVVSLYDQNKVPKLHGKLVILGLSILDSDLLKELSVNGFLKHLQEEVYPNFDTLLTPDAKSNWLSMLNSFRIGNVPTHLDHPTKIDELGRKVRAEKLAERIRVVRAEKLAERIRAARAKESTIGDKGAFVVQINGSWGVGNSTLLKLLNEELTRTKDIPYYQGGQWVIINFNAWEYQRLGHPWWWLMNALYQQGYQQLKTISRWRSVIFGLRELFWRSSRTRWFPYLVALLVLALLLIIWLLALVGILPTAIVPGWLQLQSLPGTAKVMSAVIPLIITIWGIILGISRSLLQGSERAASTFMESTYDPMEALTRHFNNMVAHIKQPVAIFIDDLDRCQDSYVVELLEGIHTLFSEPLITYVIAADQRWICASYEKAYCAFTNSVEEPGRPMRYLFLDKLFHLSTTVPAMSEDLQGVPVANGQKPTLMERLPVRESSSTLNYAKQIVLWSVALLEQRHLDILSSQMYNVELRRGHFQKNSQKARDRPSILREYLSIIVSSSVEK